MVCICLSGGEDGNHLTTGALQIASERTPGAVLQDLDDAGAQSFNTFAASYLNTQGLNNSCLKSPASTLVDLTFQSRALRSALSA